RAEPDHDGQRALTLTTGARAAAGAQKEDRAVLPAVRVRGFAGDLVVDPGLPAGPVPRDDVRRAERGRHVALGQARARFLLHRAERHLALGRRAELLAMLGGRGAAGGDDGETEPPQRAPSGSQRASVPTTHSAGHCEARLPRFRRAGRRRRRGSTADPAGVLAAAVGASWSAKAVVVGLDGPLETCREQDCAGSAGPWLAAKHRLILPP